MSKAIPRQTEALTPLHLTCETTGKNFDYEIPNDAGTLKDLWDRRLMVSCPHCHEVHPFFFRKVYVQAVLDEPGLMPIGRD